MMKKLLLVGVVAALAVVGLRGTRFLGYAKNEVASISEWADDQIPVEKKIEQMRKDVADLDRDIERVKSELAREIVDVRDLTNQVGVFRAQVEKEQKTLTARGQEIKDATEKVSIGREVVSVSEAKDRLKTDVDSHLKRKSQLGNLEKALAHRERIKETLAKQLDGMAKQKQQLKAEIDAVEAEFKALQLAQIESKYQNDDTRLSKVKENLAALRKKLDVEKERLKLSPVGREDAAPVGATQSVDDILAPLTSEKAQPTSSIDKAGE